VGKQALPLPFAVRGTVGRGVVRVPRGLVTAARPPRCSLSLWASGPTSGRDAEG
jgi:hypothetical protein